MFYFLATKLHQTFDFVGSCRPHWHWLFFYEKSQQKRIQEDTSSWKSPQWSNATFSRATTRNFDLAETVTLPITVTLRRMEQRDILEGNEEKFWLSRNCNVIQFHKTFGEWSNATFSGATAQKFWLSRNYNVTQIPQNFRRMEQSDILKGNDEKFCFSRDCNVTQIPQNLRRMEHRDILKGNGTKILI